MIDRRQLLTVGGLFGALAPAGESAAYGTGQMSERSAADIVAAHRTSGASLRFMVLDLAKARR